MRQRVERSVARLRKAAHYERIAWAREASIIQDQVFYESFSGNGMLDNPEALFLALLAAPDLQHMRHVWALQQSDTNASTVQRYRTDPRVEFVAYGSPRYFAALSRSQYLVNNATFPVQFGKRDGQVYVNTWHGTPLKHMGYHIPGGGPATRNIIRNFMNADYLLSANDFMTEHIYESAFKLRGLYRGRIVQEGSPRVDRQFMPEPERAKLRAQLVSGGVPLPPTEQVVLYAPTWRGSFESPVNDTAQLLNTVRALSQQIDTSRYRVLLKVHQRVHDFAAAQPELRGVLVPNDIPTNAVLALTDVLITDYSSIFFDFLTTGRPVLFHLPDETTYAADRGLYIPPAQLPGPVSRSVDELATQLTNLYGDSNDDPLVSHAEAYSSARQRYCPREDGQAAERIVDVVFRGRLGNYDVRSDFSDGRTSILIFLGGMRTNGITQSALSLLDNLDHRRFDVSVCYPYNPSRDSLRNEAAINPNVRLFPRVGGINGSKLYTLGRRAMLHRGIDAAPAQRRAQTRLFRAEWVRCFGTATFDHIVDFSGYNPFWDYLLLQGQAKTHSIFLHSDLLADSQREVNGRRPHERNLRSVFTTYRYFDNLVSVSAALSDINKKKLAEYASPDKFVSALNTVNYRRILRMAHRLGAGSTPALGDAPRVSTEQPAGSVPGFPPVARIDPADLPSAIEMLQQWHDLADIQAEVRRQETIRELVPPIPGITTFVTTGRLSPEKNYARLIKAFDIVHRDHPNTRLVIIGAGPLYGELTARVVELGLGADVTLAGWRENPYAVMASSDCFVMSSDYEGHPMVLLEAMVLGLPVVTTDFAAVRGALPDGYGSVVPRDVEALADGMRGYVGGKLTPPVFDYVEHNRRAIRQFEEAIGVISAIGSAH